MIKNAVLILFCALCGLAIAACSKESPLESNPFMNSATWKIEGSSAYLSEKGFSEANTQTYISMSCSDGWKFKFIIMPGKPPRKMSAILDKKSPLEVGDFGIIEEYENILDAKYPIMLSSHESLSVDYVTDGEFFSAEFDISDIESGFAKLKPNCIYADD